MTKREKYLSWGVGGILALVLGRFLVRAVIIDPIVDKNQKIAGVRDSIEKRENRLGQVTRLKSQWRELCSETVADDPQEAGRVLTLRVNLLVEQAGLAVSVNPLSVSPKKASGLELYYPVAVTVTGKGTLPQIRKFLEMIYREPYLIKVTGFGLRPQTNTDVITFSNCRIEALVPAKPALKDKSLVVSRSVLATQEAPVYHPDSRYDVIASLFRVQPPAMVEAPRPPEPTGNGERGPPRTWTTPQPPPPPYTEGGRPGDLIGTVVAGPSGGVYLRDYDQPQWYKIGDQVKGYTLTFVHPLGMVLKAAGGEAAFVEIGQNVDQARRLTAEALPELYQAWQAIQAKEKGPITSTRPADAGAPKQDGASQPSGNAAG